MPTHRLLDIVELKLREMTHLELGHFVVGLADAIAVHPQYQDSGSIPAPLLKPDQLRQIGLNHIAATKAADGHDRYLVAARDALRPTTELHPTMFVQWAVIRSVAENDPGMIAGLGLQPKIVSAKSSAPVAVTTPQNVKAKHGGTGTVIITTNKVPKSLTYEVGICQGDPSLEESWSTVGPFNGCRNMELHGLEPGKLYYFRVRCFGAGGLSPWSAIISLRVL